MTDIHVTASINVEASLNAWMQTQLALVTKPSFLASYNVVMIEPQVALAPPAFSFTHLPAGTLSRYQGNAASDTLKGYFALGIFDVSAWVTRESINWRAQLRWMVAAVERVVIGQAHGAVEIQDYLTDPNSPTDSNFRVTLGSISKPQLVIPNETFDPNPNIERVRMLIDYQWIQRSA